MDQTDLLIALFIICYFGFASAIYFTHFLTEEMKMRFNELGAFTQCMMTLLFPLSFIVVIFLESRQNEI